MDATFRMRRRYRNLGLITLPAWLAFGTLAVWVALTDPDVGGNRAAAAALMGGIPLFMGGVSLWLLAAYRRQSLEVRGDRLAFRGVWQSREIDLRDVSEARWRLQPSHGSLMLRSGPVRITIFFENYEAEARPGLVRYFREALPPEVQEGWNRFEYRYGYLRPRPIKPGPGEVLVGRGRWARFFLPGLLIGGLAGIVAWWGTGQWSFAVGPIVGILLLWVSMRASTPAEGMVKERFSAPMTPDTVRFFWFLLLWGAVNIAGVWAFDRFGARLAHPNAVAIAGGIVWFGVLMVEAGIHDRHWARREQEAADLAAKARPMDLS
jgi:hypothetical protein